MHSASRAALLVLLLAPAAARAQRGVDAQQFHPALDGYGIFQVERTETARAWDLGFKLFANYGANPLKANGTVLMDRQVGFDLGMSLGLTRYLELVLAFPVSWQSYTPAYGSYGSYADSGIVRSGFYASGGYTNVAPPDAAPGDARLGFKARFFHRGMFGLGATAIVTLPFGDDSAFLGDTNFTFQPKLIADLTHGPITAAINLGAIIREETRIADPADASKLLFDVGHELTWSAGIAYRFVHWVAIAGEVSGLVPLVGGKRDYTAEVLGGFQFFPARDLVVAAGGGASVWPGGDRHADYRVFLGVTYAPTEGKGATVVGGVDSDRDGIPDSQDVCPNQAEDRDGFDDEDGCPDPDNDQDGIPDTRDRCPNDPEDRDGFQDDDGCPDTDNDGDGIPDVQDQCPNDPEDKDGFRDSDGCPDKDNDGDGIPDELDRCPNERETFNGVDDEDGCPDSGGAVVLTDTKIELPDQITFDTGRTEIQRRVEALLNRVADKLKAHSNVKRVRIEGHTDDVGSAQKNHDLSQQRAEAVREYLIERGIEPDRLQAVGYGNTRPLDTHKTAAARAKNRRVDFIIVEQ
jgi:outer membrane protein OmpA-like peptidoglycan-associated protein